MPCKHVKRVTRRATETRRAVPRGEEVGYLREKEGDGRKDRGVVVVEGEAVVAIVVGGGRGGGG